MTRFSRVSVASSPFVDNPVSSANENASPTRLRSLNDSDLSELNEKIYQLQFELKSMEQDNEMSKIHQEKIIRNLQDKLTSEGIRADRAESDQTFLFNKTKELTEKLEKQQEKTRENQRKFENRIHQLEEVQLALEDELMSTKQDLDDQISKQKQEIDELTTQNTAILRDRDEQVNEIQVLLKELSEYRSKSVKQEEKIVQLQTDITNLTSQIDDQKDSEKIQNAFTDNVRQLTELQELVDKQRVEISQLTEAKTVLGVVEEERNDFKEKAAMIPRLQDQIVSLEQELKISRDQQLSWKSYLDDDNSSPEEIVRSLMKERVEKISLLERLGRIEAELTTKTDQSELIQQDIDKLNSELQDTKNRLKKEADHRARLEKLNEFSATEIEVLKNHLNNYENETSSNDKTVIEKLEKLVSKYREETNRLTTVAAEKEGLVTTLSSPLRRPRESDGSERLSEAQRKIRNLQIELEKKTNESQVLERDVKMLKEKLKNSQSSHDGVRILQLRENPTANHENIKQTTLDTLRLENESLLAQLEGKEPAHDKLVPHSVLERIRQEMKQVERDSKEQAKRTDRLKEVFSKKSLEFREVILSILGYQIDLLPNRKVTAKSVYSDKSFTFLPDPKNKTKFIGLDEGDFDAETENLVTFWIKERRNIPCFLAAETMELYDKRAS